MNVTYGQFKLKNYMIRFDKRIEALSEIWNYYKNEMIKEGLVKKASKKKQALVPKLTSMSDDIKMAVIKMYLKRQKVRH